MNILMYVVHAYLAEKPEWCFRTCEHVPFAYSITFHSMYQIRHNKGTEKYRKSVVN